ncbi:hypothetical protein GJAV_G00120900 [Gymnothorax javanicus]|nr:hypothetical protein GJAV_G00120900 [Gymnothorax javanicus]
MKAEGRRSKCIRYHELELQKTLRENLRFKLVVEYPEFHIALGEHWGSYTLPTPESQPDPGVTAATGSASHGDVGGDMMSQCRVVVTPPSCAGAGDQDELEEGEIRSDAEGP